MIGLATIGQAPRTDVLPSMFHTTPPSSILQAGALDELSDTEIACLYPASGEHPLVTRTVSGSEVVIAKERVLPLLHAAVDRLEVDGATLVCVLCTGEFNLPAKRARLVYPDRLMLGVVESLLPHGHLGVLIPHDGQRTSMCSKWGAVGRDVAIEASSPYSNKNTVGEAVENLVRSGSELIVLDCMGYDVGTQRAAHAVTDVPVILANRLVGAILESMVATNQER